MPAKCALGCRTNEYPMHVFPNPERDPERFRLWMDVLGDAPPFFTDDQIYKRLRVCDRHFANEHRARFKRLTVLAVPYRESVESKNEAGKCQPDSDDNVDETVEVYADNGEDIELGDDFGDDHSEDPSPEGACPNDPEIKYLFEDGLTRSSPLITIEDADTPKMAKYYHKRWSIAQKQLELQNNQLSNLRKKMATYKPSKKQALEIITKNMTSEAKLFIAMQTKRLTNPSFTKAEKALSFSIYRKSPKCYQLLEEYFVLPTNDVMRRFSLESTINCYSSEEDV